MNDGVRLCTAWSAAIPSPTNETCSAESSLSFGRLPTLATWCERSRPTEFSNNDGAI